MKAYLAAVLLALSMPAFADSSHECQGNSCNGNGEIYNEGGRGGNGGMGIGVGIGMGVGQAHSSSKSSSVSSSGSQAGASATSGNSYSGGNTSQQTVNVTDSGERHYSGSYTSKFAPAAPDVIANPTAPCRIAAGIGGSWIGGSIGLGSSILDEGCDLRERVRLLHNLGLQNSAILLFCTDPGVAKVVSQCAQLSSVPVVSAEKLDQHYQGSKPLY